MARDSQYEHWLFVLQKGGCDLSDLSGDVLLLCFPSTNDASYPGSTGNPVGRILDEMTDGVSLCSHDSNLCCPEIFR